MTIVQVEFESEQAKQLLALLNAEWDDLTEFDRFRSGLTIPSPFVAIEQGNLIGGASFTSYEEPGGENIVLWLNALYVLPAYRGHGFASNIIVEVMKHYPTLFALTDIPELYTKLGWKVKDKTANGTIVYT